MNIDNSQRHNRKQKIGLLLGVPGCGKTTFINQVLEGKLPSYLTKFYQFQIYDCICQDQDEQNRFQIMDSFGLQSETQADTPNQYMQQITQFYRQIHNQSFNRIFILCKFDRIATMKEQLTICIIPLRKYLNIMTLVVTHFEESTDDNKVKDEELIQKNIVKFFRLNSLILSPNNLEGSIKQQVYDLLPEEQTTIDLLGTKFDTKQYQNKELEEQLKNIGIQAKQEFIKEKEREFALQQSYEKEFTNYRYNNNQYQTIHGLFVGFNLKIQTWQMGHNIPDKQATFNYEYELSRHQLIDLTNNYRIRYVTPVCDQKQLYIMLYQDYSNLALVQDLQRVTDDYPGFGVFLIFPDAIKFQARSSKAVNFIFVRDQQLLDDENSFHYNNKQNQWIDNYQNNLTTKESQNLNDQFDGLIKIKYPNQDKITYPYSMETHQTQQQPQLEDYKVSDISDSAKKVREPLYNRNEVQKQQSESPSQCNYNKEQELVKQPTVQFTQTATNYCDKFQTQLYITTNIGSGNYSYGICHNLQQILSINKHQFEMNGIRFQQDNITDDHLFSSILNKQNITQIYVNEVKKQVFLISSGNKEDNKQIDVLDDKLMQFTIIIVFPMITQLEKQKGYGNQANLNFLVKNQLKNLDTSTDIVGDQKLDNKSGIKILNSKNPKIPQPFNSQLGQKNQQSNIYNTNQTINNQNGYQFKDKQQVINKNNAVQDKVILPMNSGLNKPQNFKQTISSSKQSQYAQNNKQQLLVSGVQKSKPLAQKSQVSYINSASRRQ